MLQSPDELCSEIFALVTMNIYTFLRLKAVFQSCVCLLISVWWRQIADRNGGKKMELTFKTKLISCLMGFSTIYRVCTFSGKFPIEMKAGTSTKRRLSKHGESRSLRAADPPLFARMGLVNLCKCTLSWRIFRDQILTLAPPSRGSVAPLKQSQLGPVWAKVSHGNALQQDRSRAKGDACAALGVSSGMSL